MYKKYAKFTQSDWITCINCLFQVTLDKIAINYDCTFAKLNGNVKYCVIKLVSFSEVAIVFFFLHNPSS